MATDTDRATRIGHCTRDDLDDYVYVGRGDDGDAHFLNTPLGDTGLRYCYEIP